MPELFRKEVVAHRTDRLFGEVVISQSLSTRKFVWALGLIILLVGAWVVLGSYARIERVPGILVATKPAPKIVAMASGVVTQLDVTEGSEVAAGDRLAVIALDRTSETGTSAAAVSVDTIAAREVLGQEQLQLSAGRVVNERSRLAASIAAAEGQAAEIARQIALQTEIVASNRVMFDQIAPVVERGFVSRVEYERRRQTWLGSEQQLASLNQQRQAQLAQAAQARAQLASVQIQGLSEQSELRGSLQALQQQRAGAEAQKSYVVTAPVTGTVTAVQTNAGSVANPNAPLMTILPTGTKLKAEIYASSRAIGFVRPGQEARLLFDAFPYQRFGSFSGRITSISRVVIDPREASLPVKLEESVYKVTVSLDRQSVNAFGKEHALQPGMALTANIILERQSFLDWLLAPLRAVTRRA